MKNFNEFILEKKSINKDTFAKLKKKLKGKEMDFVRFDGDQHLLDTDKFFKWLKDELD